MRNRVIFDMDGTLVDTALATYEACDNSREAFGLPYLDKKTITRAIGIPNPKFYEILYPNFPKELIAAFGAEVEKLETKIIKKLGKKLLFPNLLNLLKYLDKQKVPMYVVSTGSENHVITTLSSSGIYSYFKKISCGELTKAKAVNSLMCSAPRDMWIIVGDRQWDANAARDNGILSIGAGFGYCDEYEKKYFDMFAETPLDIPRLLSI